MHRHFGSTSDTPVISDSKLDCKIATSSQQSWHPGAALLVILSIYGQTLPLFQLQPDHVFADSVSVRQLESFLLVTGKLLNRYSFQFSGSIVKNPFWDKSLTLRFSKEDKRRHKLRNKTNKQTTNHFKSMFRLISLRKCCGRSRYLPFYIIYRYPHFIHSTIHIIHYQSVVGMADVLYFVPLWINHINHNSIETVARHSPLGWIFLNFPPFYLHFAFIG